MKPAKVITMRARITEPGNGFPHGKNFQPKKLLTRDPDIELVASEIRKSGKNIVQIAASAEIAPTTIFNWLNGTTRRPQNFTLSAVMKALGKKHKWENI